MFISFVMVAGLMAGAPLPLPTHYYMPVGQIGYQRQVVYTTARGTVAVPTTAYRPTVTYSAVPQYRVAQTYTRSYTPTYAAPARTYAAPARTYAAPTFAPPVSAAACST